MDASIRSTPLIGMVRDTIVNLVYLGLCIPCDSYASFPLKKATVWPAVKC